MSDPVPDASPPPSDQDVLRAIVEGVEAETGEEFFRALVRHVASALGVQYAFVSEFTEDGAHFRTLALWARGALVPNVTVPIGGTPCEAVLNGQMAHHARGLQALFPRDVALVDWQAESYCGVPLFDATGAVVGHVAIVDDRPMPDGTHSLSILRIFAARVRAELERLRVEAALRASEDRYRDLYEHAPIAYATVSTDARIQSANRRLAEMFGYPLEEMIGRTPFDFSPDTPEGKARVQELYTNFLAGIDLDDTEVECRRSDGATLWVRVSFRTLRDADGRVQAARTMLVDVTARKRAEEALRTSEERLARVLHSAMDAIVTFDDAGRIELFNQAAEKVFRCPAAEAAGRPFERFVTDGLGRALAQSLRAFAERGDAEPYLWAPEGLRARDAEGREFAIEATIAHVEVAGRRLHTLILRDVDERRRTEQELTRVHRQNLYLQEEIKAVHNVDEIVGQSRALQEALGRIARVAVTDSSVLILGETGTGKELLARAIHSASARKDRPFVRVNCAVLPTGLIESELFGHERGAFTGATDRRTGRFELAHGGTIFLDEVGELPAEVQAKLLRVLQEREFERIGGSQTIKVDVRVIAATNRDLARAVQEHTFREDLYYRLNVFPLQVPPLRDRPEDIPLLVHYFVGRYAAKIGRRIERVGREAMARLGAYTWPGNVRELENVIERAVILSPGPELEVGPEVLPAMVPPPAAPPAPAGSGGPLERLEREHVLTVLKQTNWRIDGPRGAAHLLRMNPSTLRSRMKKLGIQRSVAEVS